MFVPSLSWQNDRFYVSMASQNCRFSQGIFEELDSGREWFYDAV
jgi:hypothetical protein